jgi:hypothetical protein
VVEANAFKRLSVPRPDLSGRPLYHDALAHYSVSALPCRVGDPDHKALNSYRTS